MQNNFSIFIHFFIQQTFPLFSTKGLPKAARTTEALPLPPREEGRGKVPARQGGKDPPRGHDQRPEDLLQVDPHQEL